MTLTNGSNTSITGGNTVTKTTSTHAWAYDDEKITFTTDAQYYYNGSLKYTSTNVGSGSYYPYVSLRGDAALSWTYQKGSDEIGDFIQWTFSSNAQGGNKYLGFNAAAESEEGNMSGSFVIDNTDFDHIREDGVNVQNESGTVYADDTFTVYYSLSGTGGRKARLPPPPLIARF